MQNESELPPQSTESDDPVAPIPTNEEGIPTPPDWIKAKPGGLATWNDYWRKVLALQKDEDDQDRRSKRTR